MKKIEGYEEFLKKNKKILKNKSEKAKKDYFLVTLVVNNKDKKAFEELVQKYKKPLYNFINKRIYNKEDVNEILNSAFLKVYRNLERFNFNEGNFSTWLYRITYNMIIDVVRSKKTKVDSLTSYFSSFDKEESSESTIYSLIDNSEDIEKKLLVKERNNYIGTLINQLPKSKRELIIKKYYEGLKYEEIAILMKVTVGTVKSQLNRARVELKKMLKEVPKIN